MASQVTKKKRPQATRRKTVKQPNGSGALEAEYLSQLG